MLNNINHKQYAPKYIKITKQDKESIQQFHEEIIHSLAHGRNLDNDTTKDPNINYNIQHNIIQYAKLKHVPHKVVKLIKHNTKFLHG